VLPSADPSTEFILRNEGLKTNNRPLTADTRVRRTDKSTARAQTPQRKFEEEDAFADWTDEDWEDLEKG